MNLKPSYKKSTNKITKLIQELKNIKFVDEED